MRFIKVVLTSLPIVGAGLLMTIASTQRAIADVPPTYDHFIFLPLITNDFDPTWSWTSIMTPTLIPWPSEAVMAIDRSGYIHILWDTTQSAQPRFIYHTYLTETGWTSPTNIANTLGTSDVMYPPIVGGNGTLHILWRNNLTSDGPQRILYSSFSNSIWAAESEVYTTSNYFLSTLLAMPHFDQSNTVHATILNAQFFSNEVFHSKLGISGWSKPTSITPSFSPALVWPDRYGGINIYEDDSWTNEVNYAYWRNNSFSVNGSKFSGTLSGRSTDLDGQGNLHTFWRAQVPIPGGTVNGLYEQCLNSNRTWNAQNVLSGQENVGYTFLTAHDQTSGVALVWSQDTSPARLALWTGCHQTDSKKVPLPSTAYSWSFMALALSDNPKKVCLLLSLNTSPTTYNVVCANIDR